MATESALVGPCRLLELPRNVRDKIYQELLCTNERIRIADDSPSPDVHVSVLQTCRTIYREGSKVLYGENFFQLATNDRQGINLPSETFFQKVLGLNRVRQMKKIAVEVTVGQFDNPVSVIKVAFGAGRNREYRYIQPSAFYLIPSLRRSVGFHYSKGLVRTIGMLYVPHLSPDYFLDLLRRESERLPRNYLLKFEESSSKIFFQYRSAINSSEVFAQTRELDMLHLCSLLKTIPHLEELHVQITSPMSAGMAADPLKRLLSSFLQFRALRRAVITGVDQPETVSTLQQTMTKPKPTFVFLDLPGEIRNQIYRDVLVSNEEICPQQDRPIDRRSDCLGVPLLRTNRQIFYEARQFLYSENSFVANVNVWVPRSIWKDHLTADPGITAFNAQFITKLQIIVDSRHKRHVYARSRDCIELVAPQPNPQWELWYPYCEHFHLVYSHFVIREEMPRFALRTVQTDPVMVRFQINRSDGATDEVSDGLEGSLDDFIKRLDEKLEQVATFLPHLTRLKELSLVFTTSSAKWREWGDNDSIHRLLHDSKAQNVTMHGYISPGLGRKFQALLALRRREQGKEPLKPVVVDWYRNWTEDW